MKKTPYLKTEKKLLSAKVVKGKVRVAIREVSAWCGYDEVLLLSFTAEDLFRLAADKAFKLLENGCEET